MLVQVNHWDRKDLYPNVITPPRLYLSGDAGATWHERDFNSTFDTFPDESNGFHKERNDGQLAFDPFGNLYIMCSSDVSSLICDRLTVPNINILTSGQTLGVLPMTETTTFGTGYDAPSLAVGRDPVDATKTAIYVFNGLGGADSRIWCWHGSTGDSLRFLGINDPTNPWKSMANPNVQLEDAAVGSDGTLFALDQTTKILYSLPNYWTTPTPTSLTRIAQVPNDGRAFGNEPLNGTHPPDVNLGIDVSTNTLYVAWPEQIKGLNSSNIMFSQITVTPGVQSTWSTPAAIDRTLALQYLPAIAVDPVTHSVSILYFTTDGNPAGNTLYLSVRPRMATQAPVPGGWTHADLTSFSMSSLRDGTGPVHANYTGLVMNNGTGRAVWSGQDTNVNVVGGSANAYIAETVAVNLQTSTDYILNVSAAAGSTVVLKRTNGATTVSLNGISQPLDPAKQIGQIAVSASSLTIDDSTGRVLPRFGGVFTPVGGATSSLKIISGDAQTAALYAADGTFSVDAGVLVTGTINNLEVDAGNGIGGSTFWDRVPSIANVLFVGTSGNDTLALDATSAPFVGSIQMNDLGTNDALNITGNSGDDTYTLTRGHVQFNTASINFAYSTIGAIHVIDPDGNNKLIIDASSGNPFPTPADPNATAVLFDDTTQPLKVSIISVEPNQALSLLGGFGPTYLMLNDNILVEFSGYSTTNISIGMGSTLSDFNVQVIYDGGAGSNTLVASGFATLRVNSTSSINQLEAHGHAIVNLNAITPIGSLLTYDQSIVNVNAAAQISHLSATGNAQININTTLTLPDLNASGTSQVVLTTHGTGPRTNLNVGLLSLDQKASMDIVDNFLYVDNTKTSFANVKQYWVNGYNLGTWSGTNGGITSSLVRTYKDFMGIGYYNGALQDPNNPDNVGQVIGPNSNSGTGTGIALNQILIRPTLIGDLNGDGTVRQYDVNILNSLGFFNQSTTLGWQAGDFNGDGIYDYKDVNIFNSAGNFNNGSYL